MFNYVYELIIFDNPIKIIEKYVIKIGVIGYINVKSFLNDYIERFINCISTIEGNNEALL